MNKSIILLLFLLTNCFNSWSQGYPVIDMAGIKAKTLQNKMIIEQNTQRDGILIGMQATMASIEAAEKRYEKILKKANWLKGLESMKTLLEIIQTVTCLADGLDADMLKMSLLNTRAYCRLSFDLQVALNGLEIAGDLLGMLLQEGIRMEKSERIGLFNKVYERYFESALEMNDLKLVLEKIIYGQQIKKYYVINSERMNFSIAKIKIN